MPCSQTSVLPLRSLMPSPFLGLLPSTGLLSCHYHSNVRASLFSSLHLLFNFHSTGNRNQGLGPARQRLYPWGIPHPFSELPTRLYTFSRLSNTLYCAIWQPWIVSSKLPYRLPLFGFFLSQNKPICTNIVALSSRSLSSSFIHQDHPTAPLCYFQVTL